MNQVIQDLEKILLKYNCRGAMLIDDTDLQYQCIYEIPQEGAVLLRGSKFFPKMGCGTLVGLFGFNDESQTLRSLESDLNHLACEYSNAEVERRLASQ